MIADGFVEEVRRLLARVMTDLSNPCSRWDTVIFALSCRGGGSGGSLRADQAGYLPLRQAADDLVCRRSGDRLAGSGRRRCGGRADRPFSSEIVKAMILRRTIPCQCSACEGSYAEKAGKFLTSKSDEDMEKRWKMEGKWTYLNRINFEKGGRDHGPGEIDKLGQASCGAWPGVLMISCSRKRRSLEPARHPGTSHLRRHHAAQSGKNHRCGA